MCVEHPEGYGQDCHRASLQRGTPCQAWPYCGTTDPKPAGPAGHRTRTRTRTRTPCERHARRRNHRPDLTCADRSDRVASTGSRVAPNSTDPLAADDDRIDAYCTIIASVLLRHQEHKQVHVTERSGHRVGGAMQAGCSRAGHQLRRYRVFSQQSDRVLPTRSILSLG